MTLGACQKSIVPPTKNGMAVQNNHAWRDDVLVPLTHAAALMFYPPPSSRHPSFYVLCLTATVSHALTALKNSPKGWSSLYEPNTNGICAPHVHAARTSSSSSGITP